MLAASISYIFLKEIGNAAAWLYGVCPALHVVMLPFYEGSSNLALALT